MPKAQSCPFVSNSTVTLILALQIIISFFMKTESIVYAADTIITPISCEEFRDICLQSFGVSSNSPSSTTTTTTSPTSPANPPLTASQIDAPCLLLSPTNPVGICVDKKDGIAITSFPPTINTTAPSKGHVDDTGCSNFGMRCGIACNGTQNYVCSLLNDGVTIVGICGCKGMVIDVPGFVREDQGSATTTPTDTPGGNSGDKDKGKSSEGVGRFVVYLRGGVNGGVLYLLISVLFFMLMV
ncbi:hypothetical protein HDU76_006889 [Blyttiomyces sp. JEL0837]|nr:hypothetical protein HDU76_006889 [Blyttiomyces sp. JEL0837]